uniref:Uncharacterized protein n=1 Tax=viral metagenome TaxID=1070528 RepID=A0A6M3XR85_9ZZZZ
MSSYWHWLVIGGVPALGIIGWLVYRIFGGAGGGGGIVTRTPEQIEHQRERLEAARETQRKENDAAHSAERSDWLDSVRRRREEADRDPGAGTSGSD